MALSTLPHHVYRFGNFTYDCERRTLYSRGGSPIHLTQMQRTLLELFLREGVNDSDKQVTKEEIRRMLWKDVRADDYEDRFDTAIHRHVSDLRKALKREDPSLLIEYRNGLGWHLSCKVQEEGRRLTLSVLPFRCVVEQAGDLTACEELAFVLRDRLLSRFLANSKIIVKHPSMEARGARPEDDPAVIARALNVQKIIMGTVSLRGGNAAASVRVMDKGGVYESVALEERLNDAYTAADHIANHLEDALNVTYDRRDRATHRHRDTAHSEALRLYTQGKAAWGRHTKESIELAIGNYVEAIRLDPSYVLPYAGLANAYFNLGAFGNEVMPPKVAMERTEKYADDALRIDPTCWEAHTMLGSVQTVYHWNFPAAEASFRKAIELKPEYDLAHHFYALALAAVGRFNEALEEIETAKKLNYADLKLNASYAWIYYFAGDYERAIEQARETIGMDRDFILGRVFLGHALALKGETDEAIKEFQLLVERFDAPALIGVLGYTYGRAGDMKSAKRSLSRLEKYRKQGRYFSPYNEAVIYAGMGRLAESLEALEHAFQERSSWLAYLNVDPMLAELRGQFGFKSLVKRINLNRRSVRHGKRVAS